MKRSFGLGLIALVVASLAFAQAGPKERDKDKGEAKPDTAKAQEKSAKDNAPAKPDTARARDERTKDKSPAKAQKARAKKPAKSGDQAPSEAHEAKKERAPKSTQAPATEPARGNERPRRPKAPNRSATTAAPKSATPAPTGHIKRALFATAVDAREPVGQVDSVSTAVERVYFYTEIVGLAGTTVTHRWTYGGQTRAEVPIAIGAARWRAYSSKKLLPEWTGDWTVDVLDSEGKVLGTKRLVVYAPE